jgi:chemotaxis protein histidine kinase CheA
MINDENKKIDLGSYLLMLEHPEESHPIENIESMSTTQLPTIRVKMSDLDSLVNLVGELIISKMKLYSKFIKSFLLISLTHPIQLPLRQSAQLNSVAFIFIVPLFLIFCLD